MANPSIMTSSLFVDIQLYFSCTVEIIDKNLKYELIFLIYPNFKALPSKSLKAFLRIEKIVNLNILTACSHGLGTTA